VSSLLIVNPYASGVDERRTAAVAAALGRDTEAVLTAGPGDATEIARVRAPGVERLYVFGGDGTYNEVVNGLSADTPVGFLPGGGTSVLPRALGIPRDPVVAARSLAAGRTRRISLGTVNGRRFTFSAGIGLDAQLVRRVDEWGRRHDGRRPGDLAFAWALAGLATGSRLRFDPALEVEGLGRAAFALVANCTPYTYVGRFGLALAPDASFDGGLDVVAPERVRARSIPGIVRGVARRRAVARGVLYGHDLDRVVVHCDAPTALQVDGEDLGDVELAVLEAARDALTVLV
jgi:diacylglycerol kinase family enzyme